jgi:hypothetical protein
VVAARAQAWAEEEVEAEAFAVAKEDVIRKINQRLRR